MTMKEKLPYLSFALLVIIAACEVLMLWRIW
jgi:hypothetical protein